MDFIVFLLIIGFVIIVATNMRKAEEQYKDSIRIMKKECPPHQWFWQDIVDQSGNKQGERIVCKRCGPLSKSTDGSEE